MVLNKDIYSIYNKLQLSDRLLFTYYMLNNDVKSMLDMFVCHISIDEEFIVFESNYPRYIKQSIKKLFMDGFILSSAFGSTSKTTPYKYTKYCVFNGFIQPISLN
ncbi:MAG: hypothetical protein H8E98_03020 [Bacteroidetes bacterium]|nr:hypothetical protein [Bacteroidota bacterium]